MGEALAESLTVAVREALAGAPKGLSVSFDYRGADGRLPAPAAEALRRSFALVCSVAPELLDEGAVAFDGRAEVDCRRHATLTLRIVGVGRIGPDARMRRAVERLGLSFLPTQDTAAAPRLRRAAGRCPHTDAAIEFSCVPLEVASLRVVYPGLPLLAADGAEPPAPAPPGHAWLVCGDRLVGEGIARRLERLGWKTTIESSTRSALGRMRAAHGGRPGPAAVIAVRPTEEDASPLAVLRTLLPAAARCLCAVLPDDAAGPAPAGWEVRPWPLGPADLAGLACPGRRPPAGRSAPLATPEAACR